MARSIRHIWKTELKISSCNTFSNEDRRLSFWEQQEKIKDFIKTFSNTINDDQFHTKNKNFTPRRLSALFNGHKVSLQGRLQGHCRPSRPVITLWTIFPLHIRGVEPSTGRRLWREFHKGHWRVSLCPKWYFLYLPHRWWWDIRPRPQHQQDTGKRESHNARPTYSKNLPYEERNVQNHWGTEHTTG